MQTHKYKGLFGKGLNDKNIDLDQIQASVNDKRLLPSSIG